MDRSAVGGNSPRPLASGRHGVRPPLRDADPNGAARRDALLWVIALGFLVLDLATTWYGLRLGLTESNEIALAVISRFGYLGLGGLKALAVGVAAGGWFLLPISSRFVVPVCLTFPWGLATGYNAVLIAAVLLA